ncbi:hypothetical protein [Gardnerella vaginalis]|uniref:Beta-carotene 15,15'-monooxygenase n=1 Tax=Gardnerella vaginalis TaxID=2702 RepID=A0ABD4ZB81_GARVA|nr:hypothetical protein [Gardnerella vaginalis]MBE0296813.1 hypothetical protein [Gardnerella vaginalis]MDK6695579.1 hypothetical protein [Gardnerella vaginalis]NSX25530.1 hypothetical protein [Gardnerella vaginalis]
MCNKTVNDTSYSSNKNDLYKNSIKKITDYFNERKAVSIVSAIIFCAVLGATCFSGLSVCECATIILLTVAFIINLFLGKHYIIGFIISLLAYIFFSVYTYSNTYVSILNSSIKCIPISKCVPAILVAVIYFAITCSLIYRFFQIFLKENIKYIILTSFLPIILGIIFSSRGIFNNYIFYLITFLVGFFTVLVSFENLSVLARKIFRLNIKGTEENKYKLIKVKVLILLSQVLIVPSKACLNFLYKIVDTEKIKTFLKYVDIHSYAWNGLFLIIIFLIFYSITYLIFFMCKKSIKKFIEKHLDYEKSIKHEVHTYRNHRYICKFKKSKNVK